MLFNIISGLNIIKPLQSALEGSIRSRLPPLSLKQPDDWYGFPLEAVQNLTAVCSKMDTSCVTGKWLPNSI
jgi:hypothetical protein